MDFIYPLSLYIKITQVYHSAHLGLDFGWHDMKPEFINQPIVASEAGIVVACLDGYGNTYPNTKIYGNYVIIEHADKFFTVYGHLQKGSVCVSKGQRVSKGDMIGRMGNTGYSNGTHLHYELRHGGNTKSFCVNPIDYLYVEDRSIYVNKDSLWYDKIKYRDNIIAPVQRDTSVNQVEVALDILNLREGAGINYKRLGYVPRGIYNVSSVVKNQDYTWYELGDKAWCAQVEHVTYLPKQSAKIYEVLFPFVSYGDKEALVAVAKELDLAVEISSK